MINFIQETNLRGYAFEYIMKVMLRRFNKNNFIFQTNQYDDIHELIRKYRLDVSKIPVIIEEIAKDKLRCDLIEFVLNSTHERTVLKILLYDVKTSLGKPAYFEGCISNTRFMQNMGQFSQIQTLLVDVTLFADWKFSFNIIDYKNARMREYTRVKSKI